MKNEGDDDVIVIDHHDVTPKQDNDGHMVKRTKGQDDEDSNISVVKTVMGNKSCSSSGTILVLQAVFQYLDGSELKKCRFVTRRWSALAACELLTRSKLQICFKYSEKDGQHLSLSQAEKQTTMTPKPEVTLDQFIESYESSKRLLLSPFPWVHFNFQDCHLTSPDMINFMSVYGRQMKGLTVTLDRYGSDCFSTGALDDLRKLLMTDAPNLEFLSLAGLRSSRGDDDRRKFDLFPPKPSPHHHHGRDEVIEVKLPKLITLYLDSSLPPSIVSVLLRAAENVKIVERFQVVDQ